MDLALLTAGVRRRASCHHRDGGGEMRTWPANAVLNGLAKKKKKNLNEQPV